MLQWSVAWHLVLRSSYGNVPWMECEARLVHLGASTCSTSTSFFGWVFGKQFWRNFPKVEDSSFKEAAKKYGKQDFWTANLHLHTVCPISSPHSCLKCRMPRIPNTAPEKNQHGTMADEAFQVRNLLFKGGSIFRCFMFKVFRSIFLGSNGLTRQAVKIHLRLMCRGLG